MNKVFFATLGCAKNEVDTKMMEGILNPEKYMITDDPTKAEIIFVNTCGFIDAAKEESIDTILELATLKERGNCKFLLLTGCLAQRYPEELQEEIPEVDGIMGPGYVGKINEFLEEVAGDKIPSWTESYESDYVEGVRKQSGNISEYIKISEGCNNRCTYCIIPYLRGNNKSRKIEDIVTEAEELVRSGTREIILIAQNTTDYGIDLYGEFKLAELLDRLEKIKDLKWIRVMYAYPDHFDEKLIASFKNNSKVLPYIDMPLQHGADNILRKMNRKTDKQGILNLVRQLRKKLPNLVLRSTFIVGFPGETEEDFQELLDFIRELQFDRVGAFTYSREEGTPAAEFENQVPEDVKKERLSRFMKVQQDISENKLEKRIGETLDVLIEEQLDENLYSGRSYMDAPEIDGVVYINPLRKNLNIDSFIPVKITGSMEHDLVGDAL